MPAVIIDAHLHCSGTEDTRRILETLDEADVDAAVLLAPFLTPPYSLSDRDALKRANDWVARLVVGHSDRLVGFAVVNPLHAEAANDLEDAIDRLHLRGLKLV